MTLSFRPAPAVLKDALSFQGSLEELVETPTPRLLRQTGTIAAAGLFALVLAASLSNIDVIVQASGHLAADAPTIVLQPIERSIVRTLNVRPGDVVTKGQTLATLDPTFSEADRDALLAQQNAVLATITRIDAELDGTNSIAPAATAEDAIQVRLFAEHQMQYAARLRSFDEDIGRATANIRATQDEADLLARELAAVRNMEGIRAALFATQVGSRLLLLEAQAATIRSDREHQVAVGRLTDLRHTIDSKLAERQSFISQWRGTLTEDLGHQRTELAKIDDALAKADRLRELVAIVAPANGVVLEVARRSAGSVLHEAEPLVTLLPSDAPLIADVRIASADVGNLRAGDPVLLKIDAYPYQQHGMLHGHLRAISQQTIAAETLTGPDSKSAADAYHRAQIVIDGGLPDGAAVGPGMTLTAELKTGSHSVASYFLSPITKGFSESLREP